MMTNKPWPYLGLSCYLLDYTECLVTTRWVVCRGRDDHSVLITLCRHLITLTLAVQPRVHNQLHNCQCSLLYFTLLDPVVCARRQLTWCTMFTVDHIDEGLALEIQSNKTVTVSYKTDLVEQSSFASKNILLSNIQKVSSRKIGHDCCSCY